MSRLPSISILLLLVLAASPLSGQTEPAGAARTAAKGSESQRWLSFSSAGSEGAELPELYLRTIDGTYQVISVGDLSRGKRIGYGGELPIVVYRKNPVQPTAQNPEPEPYIPVGKVTIPEEWTQVLVFLAPVGKGGAEIRSFALNDHPDVFPSNSYRIVNFHNDRVAARIAGESFILSPGEDRIVNHSAKEGDKVDVLIQAANDEKVVPITSSYFRQRKNIRVLSLIRLRSIDGEVEPDVGMLIDRPSTVN